jgi:competence protein CoiA
MLFALRKSDGQLVEAYFASPRNGPFLCADCGEEVILKSGRSKVNHFAHGNPLACTLSSGESDLHRRCKLAIFQALQKQSPVSDLALERSLGTVRPDVFAVIRGTPVAIEVQISSLSLDIIMRRTIDYAQRGIYVLWLLQWTPRLAARRYTPELWEKWVHAAYFGRVYYWLKGLTVASYHFEASFRKVPLKSWYAPGGKKMTAGGYSVKSKRHRHAVRGNVFNLLRDFGPKERYWWEGNGLRVPDAKLFMDRGDNRRRETFS